MSSKSSSSQNDEDSTSKGFAKADDSEPSRLPFEPRGTRKKQPPKSVPVPTTKVNSEKLTLPSTQASVRQRALTGVPEVVSQRMARRMALFCGIPTSLGMLSFVVSYFIVSRHLFNLPTIAVLLVSLGFFGLGVLGLSYGALSASWDEDRVGGWFGFSEFKVNLGRSIASWKEARQKPL